MRSETGKRGLSGKELRLTPGYRRPVAYSEPFSRRDLVKIGPGINFRPRVDRPLPLPVCSTNSAYRGWSTCIASHPFCRWLALIRRIHFVIGGIAVQMAPELGRVDACIANQRRAFNGIPCLRAQRPIDHAFTARTSIIAWTVESADRGTFERAGEAIGGSCSRSTCSSSWSAVIHVAIECWSEARCSGDRT